MMRDERVLALAIHFIPAIQSQSLILPFVGFPLFSSEKKSNNHVDLNLLEATLLEQNSENAFDTKLTLHQCLWCCHTPFWFALFLYIYLLFCAGREREAACMAWTFVFCRICLSVPFYVRHIIPCHYQAKRSKQTTTDELAVVHT